MTELSIVVPTYNEKSNIYKLLESLEVVLEDVSWEIIFVDDDSPDETADEVRKIAQVNPKVRIIHRIGRHGLSSACTEGALSSSSKYVMFMDADMQHDEKIISKMLSTLKSENYNLVVGSRFIDGASASGGLNKIRENGSKLAIWMSQFILKPIQLNDTMSGFFMIERQLFAKYANSYSRRGFKILFDLVMCAKKEIKLKEIGYSMRARYAGDSKMDHKVVIEYLELLIEHSIGKVLPVRFIFFLLVGFSGLLIHLLNLFIFYKILSYDFYTSQLISTMISMTTNYLINNIMTYRDRMLRGMQLIYGLFSFYIICGIGAWGNLTMSSELYESGITWMIAGLVGAGISSVWNYSVSSKLTWRWKIMSAGDNR
jgi:dolichol-phosphate mannosyltransferase